MTIWNFLQGAFADIPGSMLHITKEVERYVPFPSERFKANPEALPD